MRQVLLVLRRALYARRRNQPPGGTGAGRSAPAGRSRSARAHAARPERQCLSRARCPGARRRARRTVRPTGRNRRAGAPALHHQPSLRHDRRADRGASRQRQADALPPPAGAVGLRHDPQGDEPAAQPRRLPPHHRAYQGGASGHGALGRFHRRLPGRNGRGFRTDPQHCSRSRLCQRLHLQIFDPSRHAGRRNGRTGPRGGEDGAACPPQRARDRPDARLRALLRRAHLRRTARKTGPPAEPARRSFALPPGGASGGARRPHRHRPEGADRGRWK